ncbi:MAG: hypothetical protein ACRDIB_02000, partial [Ardenticatenaceae bacterium]
CRTEAGSNHPGPDLAESTPNGDAPRIVAAYSSLAGPAAVVAPRRTVGSTVPGSGGRRPRSKVAGAPARLERHDRRLTLAARMRVLSMAR